MCLVRALLVAASTKNLVGCQSVFSLTKFMFRDERKQSVHNISSTWTIVVYSVVLFVGVLLCVGPVAEKLHHWSRTKFETHVVHIDDGARNRACVTHPLWATVQSHTSLVLPSDCEQSKFPHVSVVLSCGFVSRCQSAFSSSQPSCLTEASLDRT